MLIYISKMTHIIRFQKENKMSVSFGVHAGADKHGQAGSGASSAFIRHGHRGGKVGGTRARHRSAEPEPGQYGLQHASVHQVGCWCSDTPHGPAQSFYLLLPYLTLFLSSTV